MAISTYRKAIVFEMNIGLVMSLTFRGICYWFDAFMMDEYIT